MMCGGLGDVLRHILSLQVDLGLRLVNLQCDPRIFTEFKFFFKCGIDVFVDNGQLIFGEGGDCLPEYSLLKCDEGHLARMGKQVLVLLQDGGVGSKALPFTA